PTPVRMRMLFGATNEIPEFSELAALRDRFTLKVESRGVRGTKFSELVAKGLLNEQRRAFNQRPWAGLASLEDFEKLKLYLDHLLLQDADEESRRRHFPDDV